MSVVVLVGVLSLVVGRLAVPVFEGVFGTLIASAIVWFLAANALIAVGIDPVVPAAALSLAIGSILVTLGALYTRFGLRSRWPAFDEYLAVLAFIVVFSIAYLFCLLWPDFIAMGERLRDYSLLASTIHSPVAPLEPWMDGATLNYYVFWYRFGHLLSVLLGLQVWETYHILAAFALSFYSAVLFQFVRVVFRGGVITAAFTAIALPFGSNVEGMLLWWNNDSGWWGPSRVVKGAINEFPAWSFLLGDLHPHFLNLAAIPFALLILYRIVVREAPLTERVVDCGGIVVATTLFLFASNAWEVPMWLATVAILAIVSAYQRRGLLFVQWSALRSSDGSLRCNLLAAAKSPRLWLALVYWLTLIVALKLESRHIVPEGGSPKLVRAPIEVTTTGELFRHWGFFLSALAFATVLYVRHPFGSFVIAVLLGFATIYDKGALFLYTLLGGLVVGWMFQPDGREEERRTPAALFGLCVALSAIVLILTPEIVFLDDPYGGENERMNTIFKIYTTAWGLIGLGSVWMVYALCGPIAPKLRMAPVLNILAWLVLPICFLGVSLPFFGHTVPLRVSQPTRVAPAIEGLSELDSRYPGSVEIIRALRNSPRGVVLEAQGNAYDYTTFVTTLAAQPAYLGWANHVNLLTRRYEDVSKREKSTEEIYTKSDCEARKALLTREGIQYVVVGGRERERYPAVASLDFSCLSKVAESKEFALYAVRPS